MAQPAALGSCWPAAEPGLGPTQRRRLTDTARRPAGRKNWIRIPAILYGAFVTATMLPILAELALHEGEPGIGASRPHFICPLHCAHSSRPASSTIHLANRLRLYHLSATAAPGYQRAAVTSFYSPYLVVPLVLALHMAATPQPFGSAAAKAKRQ